MSNPYYNHGTTPATNSAGSSALVRAEFDSITTGFGLLPAMSGSNFIVRVNAGATALEAVSPATILGAYVPLAGGVMSGALGVYTTGAVITPSFPVDVVGTVNVRDNRNLGTTVGAKLFGGDAGNNPWVGSNSALPFELRVNSAAQVTIDASGNAGFGQVPTATYRVDANGTVRSIGGETTSGYGFRVLNSTANGGGELTAIAGASAGIRIGSDSGPMIFFTTAAERARIDTSGNMLVGGAAAIAGYRISVTTTSTTMAAFDSTAANGGLVVFTRSGAAYGFIGNSNPLIGGPNTNLAVRSESALDFGVNGGTLAMRLTAAGVVQDGNGNSFQPVVRAVKTAATARSSTVALADDPHLVVALGIGTWSYRVWLPVWCTTANTGQFKVAVAYSSTSTTNSMGVTGSTGVNSGFTYNLVPGATGAGAIVPGVGAAPVDFVLLEGVLVATGAGNISVQWAQTVSNGNAVNVGIGGYITCTKIA